MYRLLALAIATLLLNPGSSWAQRALQSKHPLKEMNAFRVTGSAPKIDGLLNDEAWTQASPSGDFQQLLPIENATPTESTLVYIVYDDDAVYLGFNLFDKEPDKIVARLSRRAQGSETDRINVSFDPYLDHQTGYQFTITAGGSLTDALLYGDTRSDFTWDAIWEAQAAMNERGWSAEFRIPFTILKFQDQEGAQTWGFQVTRYISRKQEWLQWVLQRRDNSGWVSRFGHINGFEGIKPKTPVQILPYTVGRSTFEPKSAANTKGREYFSNAGADLRYGITSNATLQATVNPDFGQVDADPAELNLSVFETFFSERRPFFVEGQQMFQTPIQLFYSRRIGRQPNYFSVPNGAVNLDPPDYSTILAATKLTGKTRSKTSFGLVHALTSAENTKISLGGNVSKFKVEPLTNFVVGRLTQDFRGGNSQIGIIGTTVIRSGGHEAYSGGVDWSHKMYNNLYRFSGQIAGARTGRATVQQGYGFTTRFAKQDGWFQGDLSLDMVSPAFNPNDIGASSRPNRINIGTGIDVNRIKPFGPFLSNSGYVNVDQTYNYQNLHLQNQFNFGTSAQFTNFWHMQVGGAHQFEALDDLDTRGGPPIQKPASNNAFIWIGTDFSKPISANLLNDYTRNAAGSSNWFTSLNLTFRPSARIEVRLNPSYSHRFNDAQYIRQDASGGPTKYVYGELKSRVVDLTTRADILFTRDVSLQFYIQPFVAVGDYDDTAFKSLAAPSTYTFTPFTGQANRDFTRRSLRSNLVFRWEYRPGSTVFLVWSQSRSAAIAGANPTFKPFNSIGDVFSDAGPNIFMVKFNYFFNI